MTNGLREQETLDDYQERFESAVERMKPQESPLPMMNYHEYASPRIQEWPGKSQY